MNMAIRLVGISAVATGAYFTYKSVMENHTLEEAYKQFRDTASTMSATSKDTPTVLVLGFQNHGRSSFINTVFRVLYREDGPLVMRAETGPLEGTTTETRVFKVKNKLLRYPQFLLNLIDAPAISTSDSHTVDEEALRRILRGETLSAKPECVVVVARSEDSVKGAPAWNRLQNMAKLIREEGLQFVIVLTHKKQAKAAKVDLEELTRSVAQRAGTDFVQCIDNYIAEHRSDGQNGVAVKNDLDTDMHTLSVITQCFEYVKRHRKKDKTNKGTSTIKAPTAPISDEDEPASNQDSD